MKKKFELDEHGMKIPSEYMLKHMPVVGYIYIYRKNNPDHLIECNLNRQAFLIAVGGKNSGNVWSKATWPTLFTKGQIEKSNDNFDFYLYEKFEDLIEAHPFLYEKYRLLQPPSDLRNKGGKYYDRQLTHFEHHLRRGWDEEEYNEFYSEPFYDKIRNKKVPSSNVFLRDEINE